MTFFFADTLSNVFIGEKEKYQYETDVCNIIVKVVDTDADMQYDFFTLPVDQKITLEEYLKKKLKENKKYLVRQKKEVWYSPDTSEKLTLQKVEENVSHKLLMTLMDEGK